MSTRALVRLSLLLCFALVGACSATGLPGPGQSDDAGGDVLGSGDVGATPDAGGGVGEDAGPGVDSGAPSLDVGPVQPPDDEEPRPENCADGVDNDFDGDIDCDDVDCFDNRLCRDTDPGDPGNGGGGGDPGNGNDEESGFQCFDREDNDGDGLVDCDDDSCADSPLCQGGGGGGFPGDDEDTETGRECRDGADNDGDGLVDCDDDDCEDSRSCRGGGGGGGFPGDGEDDPATETMFECLDRDDNDGDGLVDCDDDDCAEFPLCG